MRVLLLAAVALLLAPVAHAERPLPWSSGPDHTGETEAALSGIASAFAERSTVVRCWGEHDWAVLVARTFGEGATSRGFVPWNGTQIGNVIELNPGDCWHLDSFIAKPPKLLCGTKVVSRTVKKAVMRMGKRVVVRRTVKRVVAAPPVCPELRPVYSAAQTLAHETMHVRGILDEAIAECYGRQLVRHVLTGLGAPAAYAARVQTLDLINFGLPANYYSPECRENGLLDLTPGDGVWP